MGLGNYRLWNYGSGRDPRVIRFKLTHAAKQKEVKSLKLYSKPNKNGKRQFLGWEASYWALKRNFDRLASKRWMEEITSEQIDRYRQSQYVVMEQKDEIKRLKKLLRKNGIEY